MRSLAFQTKKEIIVSVIFALIIVILVIGIIDVRNHNEFLKKMIEQEKMSNNLDKNRYKFEEIFL